MHKNFAVSIILISLLTIFFSGCTPSSSTLRYQNYTGVETYEDSVKVGLIKSDDDLLYYSQIQDTSAEFQDWEIDDSRDLNESDNIDISSILRRIKASIDNSDSNSTKNSLRERVLIEIIKFMDTPYKYGGNSLTGIDCSAFTQNVFNNCLGVNLLRSAREQFTQGNSIKEKDDLIFGDLVFFNTRKAVRPGHVGIYIGDNLFAHASSSKGVIVSSLDHRYYAKKYMGARRMNNMFSNIEMR